MTYSKLSNIETCHNCEDSIGILEDAYVFKDRPVCKNCYNELKPYKRNIMKYVNRLLWFAFLAGVVMFAVGGFLVDNPDLGGNGLFVAVGSVILLVVLNVLRLIFRPRRTEYLDSSLER